jgi:hypothetical protein
MNKIKPTHKHDWANRIAQKCKNKHCNHIRCSGCFDHDNDGNLLSHSNGDTIDEAAYWSWYREAVADMTF